MFWDIASVNGHVALDKQQLKDILGKIVDDAMP